MAQDNTRAIVTEIPPSDLEIVRQELSARDFSEILRVDSPEEAARALKKGANFAVVSLGADSEIGTDIIVELKRERPDLPIIAIGATPQPDLIVRAVRAGAAEFLVPPIEASEFGQAIDRALKARGSGARIRKCIAVYSAKGGLGDTTVAVNLAFALANLEPTTRVALVDLVVQGGDARVLLDIRPTYTIKDLAEKLGDMDGQSLETFLHACPGDVWVCPDPNLPDEGELLDPQCAATIVRRLARTFDYTIVDCEHSLNDRTLAILDLADTVVLVTSLTVPAVRSLQRTLDLFSRLGYPPEKTAVVVNRYGSRGDLKLSDLEEVVGGPVAATLPNDYKATINAAARGQPVYQARPKSKLALHLNRLATHLNGGPGPGRGRRKFRIKKLKRSKRKAKV